MKKKKLKKRIEELEYELHCAYAKGYKTGYEFAQNKFEQCKNCAHREEETWGNCSFCYDPLKMIYTHFKEKENKE